MSLSVSDISYSFSKIQPVFKSISLDVCEGEVVAIMGPSGCGKSTLLRCIAGLLDPLEGNIIINGISPKEAQAKKMIGIAFQDETLVEWLNVKDNLLLPTKIGQRNENKVETFNDIVKLINLEDYIDFLPHQLSGGMKQRVSFGRSLITNPSLLLMDEPFSALDFVTKTKILVDFSKILSKINTPLIMITHHCEDAVMLADKIIILGSKPAKIKKVMKVKLPKTRDLSVLESLDFINIVNECRDSLINLS